MREGFGRLGRKYEVYCIYCGSIYIERLPDGTYYCQDCTSEFEEPGVSTR